MLAPAGEGFQGRSGLRAGLKSATLAVAEASWQPRASRAREAALPGGCSAVGPGLEANLVLAAPEEEQQGGVAGAAASLLVSPVAWSLSGPQAAAVAAVIRSVAGEGEAGQQFGALPPAGQQQPEEQSTHWVGGVRLATDGPIRAAYSASGTGGYCCSSGPGVPDSTPAAASLYIETAALAAQVSTRHPETGAAGPSLDILLAQPQLWDCGGLGLLLPAAELRLAPPAGGGDDAAEVLQPAVLLAGFRRSSSQQPAAQETEWQLESVSVAVTPQDFALLLAVMRLSALAPALLRLPDQLPSPPVSPAAQLAAEAESPRSPAALESSGGLRSSRTSLAVESAVLSVQPTEGQPGLAASTTGLQVRWAADPAPPVSAFSPGFRRPETFSNDPGTLLSRSMDLALRFVDLTVSVPAPAAAGPPRLFSALRCGGLCCVTALPGGWGSAMLHRLSLKCPAGNMQVPPSGAAGRRRRLRRGGRLCLPLQPGPLRDPAAGRAGGACRLCRQPRAPLGPELHSGGHRPGTGGAAACAAGTGAAGAGRSGRRPAAGPGPAGRGADAAAGARGAAPALDTAGARARLGGRRRRRSSGLRPRRGHLPRLRLPQRRDGGGGVRGAAAAGAGHGRAALAGGRGRAGHAGRRLGHGPLARHPAPR